MYTEYIIPTGTKEGAVLLSVVVLFSPGGVLVLKAEAMSWLGTG